jgi:hypothetical protein
MGTCGLLFQQWKGLLEDKPEPYFVRRIQAGIVWRNKAAQEALHMPEESTWEETAEGLEDSVKANDAHSAALKTGRGKTAICHIKGRGLALEMSCEPDYCTGCSNRCAVIVALASVVVARSILFALAAGELLEDYRRTLTEVL